MAMNAPPCMPNGQVPMPMMAPPGNCPQMMNNMYFPFDPNQAQHVEDFVSKAFPNQIRQRKSRPPSAAANYRKIGVDSTSCTTFSPNAVAKASFPNQSEEEDPNAFDTLTLALGTKPGSDKPPSVLVTLKTPKVLAARLNMTSVGTQVHYKDLGLEEPTLKREEPPVTILGAPSTPKKFQGANKKRSVRSKKSVVSRAGDDKKLNVVSRASTSEGQPPVNKKGADKKNKNSKVVRAESQVNVKVDGAAQKDAKPKGSKTQETAPTEAATAEKSKAKGWESFKADGLRAVKVKDGQIIKEVSNKKASTVPNKAAKTDANKREETSSISMAPKNQKADPAAKPAAPAPAKAANESLSVKPKAGPESKAVPAAAAQKPPAAPPKKSGQETGKKSKVIDEKPKDVAADKGADANKKEGAKNVAAAAAATPAAAPTAADKKDAAKPAAAPDANKKTAAVAGANPGKK